MGNTKFYKMNGIGNDYIFIYLPEMQLKNIDFSTLAKRLSDRHFGIGGDGLVTIDRLPAGALNMRIFNSDGSEAETCGNALRCTAFLAYSNAWMRKKEMRIKTASGIHLARIIDARPTGAKVAVTMGKPAEFNSEMLKNMGCYAVNVGNIHAVLFDESGSEQIYRKAKCLSETYPDGINVEVVKIIGNSSASVRVFERGSGETLACGSGATAVAYVLKKYYYTNSNKINIHLAGGTLIVEFDMQGTATLIGDASLNFVGEAEI